MCRKTWFSQTTGVDVPLPGTFAFHFTFLVSLHSIGGSPVGETPLVDGPRHAGQFCSGEDAAADNAASEVKNKVKARSIISFLFGRVRHADDTAGNAPAGVPDRLPAIIKFRVHNHRATQYRVLVSGHANVVNGQFEVSLAARISFQIAEVPRVPLRLVWQPMLMLFRIIVAASAGTVRARAVLSAQSDSAEAGVSSYIEEYLVRFRAPSGGLIVPMPAIIGSGTRAA